MTAVLPPPPAEWRTLPERREPVSLVALLDAWVAVLERPDHPDLDSVAAFTVDTHGRGSVQLCVDEHRAFLLWATWLDLDFTRVYRAGGLVIAARGVVKAGPSELVVHVSYAPMPAGIPA